MKKQAVLIALASAIAFGTLSVPSFAQDGPGAGTPAVQPGNTVSPTGKIESTRHRRLYNRVPTMKKRELKNHGGMGANQ